MRTMFGLKGGGFRGIPWLCPSASALRSPQQPQQVQVRSAAWTADPSRELMRSMKNTLLGHLLQKKKE